MKKVMNTKLAVEYQRQYSRRYPGLNTNIVENNGNIFLDFEFPYKSNLLNQTVKYDCSVWYESKAYNSDIVLHLSVSSCPYEMELVESHKTVEMNIDNLLIAVQKNLKMWEEVKGMFTKVRDKFDEVLANVQDYEVNEAIDWGIDHNVSYAGYNADPDEGDIWDKHPSEFEEVRKAIAIFKTLKEAQGPTASDETYGVGSYGLKHRLETFTDKFDKHTYFSTGTATIAAWYVFVCDGSYTSNKFDFKREPETPNFCFNIPLQIGIFLRIIQ